MISAQQAQHNSKKAKSVKANANARQDQFEQAFLAEIGKQIDKQSRAGKDSITVFSTGAIRQNVVNELRKNLGFTVVRKSTGKVQAPYQYTISW